MQCQECGKETGNPKFCSRNCSASYNNGKVPKRKRTHDRCKHCNKELPVKRHLTSTFCSHKCFNEWRYGDWKERLEEGAVSSNTAKKYLNRLMSECGICGQGREWQGKPLILQVDHIDGDSDNNELANLRLICPNCHTQTETWCQRNHNNTKRNSYLGRYKKRVLNAPVV